jgi:hypothetical protein
MTSSTPIADALAVVDSNRADLLSAQGEFGEFDVSSERDAYLGALENLADAVRAQPAPWHSDPRHSACPACQRTSWTWAGPGQALCPCGHAWYVPRAGRAPVPPATTPVADALAEVNLAKVDGFAPDGTARRHLVRALFSLADAVRAQLAAQGPTEVPGLTCAQCGAPCALEACQACGGTTKA